MWLFPFLLYDSVRGLLVLSAGCVELPKYFYAHYTLLCTVYTEYHYIIATILSK